MMLKRYENKKMTKITMLLEYIKKSYIWTILSLISLLKQIVLMEFAFLFNFITMNNTFAGALNFDAMHQ